MDYPLQLASQLQQLLKSLRKSHQVTQAQLAQRLGVVQSRIADIERDPGTVSVEQLMNVLAMLGAQLVVRETTPDIPTTAPGGGPSSGAERQATPPASGHSAPLAGAGSASTSSPSAPSPPPLSDDAPGAEPRGQW